MEGHSYPVLFGGASLRKNKLRHKGSMRKGEKRLGDKTVGEWRGEIGKGNAMKM